MYRLKGHFSKTATSKDMVGVPGLPVANWRIGSAAYAFTCPQIFIIIILKDKYCDANE